MSLVLRKYQSKQVKEIKSFLNDGKHCLVQLPTGGGKTVIFSYIAQNVVEKNKRVLILTNRSELLNQTGGTLSDFGLDPYFIRAGTTFINFEKRVFVAMSQTLRNRMKSRMWRDWILRDIDLVIIDEAHLQDFNFILTDGILDNKYVLGFTATPKRTGNMRQLALDYEETIPGVSVSKLIKDGYLVSDDYFGVSGVDLNDIKYDAKKGDYSDKDMFARFNNPKLYAGVVENWLEIAPNSHTLAFCVNIEHVINTCNEFHKQGIDARFLVSSMKKPKKPSESAMEGELIRYEEKMALYDLYMSSYGKWSGPRQKIIRKFGDKEFPVLINAGILTTGFDCPSIDNVIINRATLSHTLYDQMIGRGSRIHPGKDSFTIMDFGNNASRFGHYSAPKKWGLWHEQPKGSGSGVAPVKDCGLDNNGRAIISNKIGCNRLIMASIKICPFCGFKYPKEQIEEVKLKGSMYDNETNKLIMVKKLGDMDEKELFIYYKIKGHKPPWLWRQLCYRGGAEKIRSFGRAHHWRQKTIETAIRYTKAA